MPSEDLRELLSVIQDRDGSLEIRDLPSIIEVQGMGHSELLKFHQLCPLSELFAKSPLNMNKNTCTFEQAQAYAIKLVRESTVHVTSSPSKISSIRLQSSAIMAANRDNSRRLEPQQIVIDAES